MAVTECPLEHRGPGDHLITPTKCAHLGDEWIALVHQPDGTVAFTAHWDSSLADVYNQESTWEAAEQALLNGALERYIRCLSS